jgi:hypothetical protein
MLAKCTNPACSATFHYLHEGKLFLIELRSDSATVEPGADPGFRGTPFHFQCFWLCSPCSRVMTIQPDGKGGVSIERGQAALLRPDGSMNDSVLDRAFEDYRRCA